ncbi:MAG TPA: proline dehydrogenase family protein [Candidatus Bilamarchaeum sp.]|nr:proline dehydrogenase family protein [Candidatus Bilamarchaeum sp.]
MQGSIVRSFGNFFFLHVMNRWVAGADAGDAAAYCRRVGSACMINLLGEHYRKSADALETVAEYKRLVDALNPQEASLTLKPSQFGFNAEDAKDAAAFCRKNLLEVARYASKKGIAVWLDMEDSRFTDFTLDFYETLPPGWNAGICLQANLLRTEKDLGRLIRLSAARDVRVRLVKGIYEERPEISVRDPGRLHARFLKLIRHAFSESPPSFGIAVGTHHEEAVGLAVRLQKKYRKKFFEIQVLKGVLPEYYKRLRASGIPLSEYVPYGKDAFAYSVRRARKNPRFASSVLFAVFFDAYKKLYH